MDEKGELAPDDRQDARRQERADRAVEDDHGRGRAATRRRCCRRDATMDARFSGAHSIIMQGIRSTMTVPLLHGDELLGIMHLDSHDRDQRVHREGPADLHAASPARPRSRSRTRGWRASIEHEAQDARAVPAPALAQPRRAGRARASCSSRRAARCREVTMLFSDIRGFTSMSESRAPQEIVHMLNEYFELMVDVLFKYEGTLDKFVGDEIIGAVRRAGRRCTTRRFKAVQCALDMLQALARVQPHARRRGPARRSTSASASTPAPWSPGAIGSLARAPVHRDRRRGERRLAPVQRRAARRDHPLRGDLPQGRRPRRGACRCRPCA